MRGSTTHEPGPGIEPHERLPVASPRPRDPLERGPELDTALALLLVVRHRIHCRRAARADGFDRLARRRDQLLLPELPRRMQRPNGLAVLRPRIQAGEAEAPQPRLLAPDRELGLRWLILGQHQRPG